MFVFIYSRTIMLGFDRLFSKGGKQNIWPDEYGHPPDPKNIDWGKSDSQLANEISKEYGDPITGANTSNNKVKKWFNAKRPKP